MFSIFKCSNILKNKILEIRQNWSTTPYYYQYQVLIIIEHEIVPHLWNECHDPNDVVDGIGENSREDVALAVNLPGVDLVEERHHHERVEDHGKVHRGRRS